MKSNEAPEKIYLVPFGKPIIEPLPQEGSLADTIWSSKPYANSNAGNIEYVRTDTFIEKACNFIREHHHEFSFWNTEEYELGFSTQKFIEDFKNYMKGE